MPPKSVPPSIKAVAFDCPHCGAYASQTWFRLLADRFTGGSRIPWIPTEKDLRDIEKESQIDPEEKARFREVVAKTLKGLVAFEKRRNSYPDYSISNIHLSKCFACEEIAI